MRNPAENNRGTTLVELVVCMALLGIFSVATVLLIQPCARAFTQMQQQTRAQNLADLLLEALRGELLQASGYLRITNGDAVGDEGGIFALAQPSDRQGTALEFGLESGYLELVDAGSIAATHLTAPGAADLEAGRAVPGYLHLRYYAPDTDPEKQIVGYPGYLRPPRHAAGDTIVAYHYTEAYPRDSYLNMTAELQFAVRGDTETSIPDGAGRAKVRRVSSLTVQVTVRNASNKEILTQKGILALPHQPILVQKGL